MSKEQDFVTSYNQVRREYTFNPDIFNDEPEKVARIKEIIDTKLTDVDRIIFVMYCEAGSLRKLAKRMGFSHTIIGAEVRRIRKTILDEYNKMQNEH